MAAIGMTTKADRGLLVSTTNYPRRMDWTLLWYVIAGIIITAGFVGSILPNLPGIPVMFGGMLLAAWGGQFERIKVCG